MPQQTMLPKTSPIVPIMSDQYPFSIQVLVTRRPNMLDDNLEYVLYSGTDVLRDIFVHERENPVKSLVLYYPERWLNIIQERCLYERLKKFCPHLKSLEIMTQSVYIVQMTKHTQVKILSGADEQAYTAEHGKLPGECATGVTAFAPPIGMDFSKIQVLGGSSK